VNAAAQNLQKQHFVDSVIILEENDQELLKKDNAHKFSKVQPHDKLAVNSRQISESEKNNIKQDNAFWYADYKPKSEAELKPRKSFLNSFFKSQWLKVFLFIILAVAIIWFLLAGDFKLFRPQSKSIKHKKNEVPDQNVFETDFEHEISKAIAANDFSLAIRLHYLQLLKILSARKIIQYSPEHTNQDFVFQLRNSIYYKEFFALTRSFEYTWYGRFNVSESAFEKIQSNFISFKKQLGS
jgi:hypothetical protein